MSDSVVKLEITMALLAGVLLLVRVARLVRLPYPAVMAVAGLGISLIPGLPQVAMDPEFVLVCFLPPILYAAAWNTSWPEFRRNLRPIGFLAFGLVLLTIVAVAVVAKVLVPAMPWSIAFVLGAVVSPPDAIAAAAVFDELPVPRRLKAILEGESLVNDAGALVAYRVALAAAVAGSFSFADAASAFMIASIGGLAIGALGGLLVVALHSRIKDPLSGTILSLIVPYAIYILTERFHGSGVFAVVTAGLIVSWRSTRVFGPTTRLVAVPVWEVVTLAVNGLAFTLIGLQFREVAVSAWRSSPRDIALCALGTIVACVMVRILFVGATAPLAMGGWRFFKADPMPRSNHAIVAWAGMRGVVSLAIALSLPLATAAGDPLPFRDLIIVTVFAVILATLVVQGLSLPRMIKAFEVVAPQSELLEDDVIDAGCTAAAMSRLDELERSGGLSLTQGRDLRGEIRAESAAERPNDLESDAESVAGGRSDRSPPTQRARHGLLGARLELIDAERIALERLRAAGTIGEEAFRRRERRLDFRELLLSDHECV